MLEDLAYFIGIISNDGISAKEFNKKLIGAIGIKDRGQLADYFTFDTPSGKVSLRLSSHYFHARTYRGKSNKAEKNVSLVITIPGVDKGKFKADRRVDKTKVSAWYAEAPNGSSRIDKQKLSTITKVINSFENPTIQEEITPDELDSEYLAAVESGDMAKSQELVNKAAEAAGYDANTDYQGSRAFNGAAPVRNGYFNTREERMAAFEDGSFEDTYSLGDYMDAGLDNHDLEWQLANPIPASARDKATLESINNLNNVVKDQKQTIKMYRAVPADVKEDSFRNGDWITPSRMYAEQPQAA